MELTDNQGPCETGEDIYASAQTTTEGHWQLLPYQWQGIFPVHFEGLLDEALTGLVDCQMYFRPFVLELSKKA